MVFGDILKSGLERNEEGTSFFGFNLPGPLQMIYDLVAGPEKEQIEEEVREVAEQARDAREEVAKGVFIGLLENEDAITDTIVGKMNLDSFIFRNPWLRSRVGLKLLRWFPPFAKAYDFFSEENYSKNEAWIAEVAAEASGGDPEKEAKLKDSADDLRLLAEYMEGKEIDWSDVYDTNSFDPFNDLDAQAIV